MHAYRLHTSSAMEVDFYLLTPGVHTCICIHTCLHAYMHTCTHACILTYSHTTCIHAYYVQVDPYMLAPGAQGADSAVGTADGMPADFGWGLRLQQPFFMVPFPGLQPTSCSGLLSSRPSSLASHRSRVRAAPWEGKDQRARRAPLAGSAWSAATHLVRRVLLTRPMAAHTLGGALPALWILSL